MNKRKLAFLMLCMCMITSFIGCSDDDGYKDVDGLAPAIALEAEHIQSAAGREITFNGTVTDNDGISTIKLECADLYLNKTINLIEIYDELLTTYDLSYKFNLQADEIGERFTVKVTVTDVGGRSASQDILLTLDADFENPVFTAAPDANVIVLIKNETIFKLSFSVSDDRAIDYVTIDIPGVDGFDARRVDAEGKKTFDFTERIKLPDVIENYDLSITAVDKLGKTVSTSTVISVSEMPDFQRMYLADVATVAELNSDVFGVPMRIERTDAYKYKANYYNQAAGTEIFFIPQKSDFSPICFGLDPDDNTRLTDDPDVSQPIVLTEANTYYEITFDVMESTYEISTYSIAEAIDPIPHTIGSISLDTWGNGTWLQEFYIGYMTNRPPEVQRIAQDATNPHLFYMERPFSLTAGEKMHFLFHNWHSSDWWNYCTWRVDSKEEPEIFNYYGTVKNPAWTKPNTEDDNWAEPTVVTTGSYRLYFDAHLGRAKLVRE